LALVNERKLGSCMTFSKVEQFFSHYADIINNKSINIKALTEKYSFPCILVQDEPQKVISSGSEFSSVMENVLADYQQLGVVNFSPNITKVLNVSSNMTFVAIQWSFKNENDEQVLCFNNSYLLSNQNDELNIVVFIVDESDEIFASHASQVQLSAKA